MRHFEKEYTNEIFVEEMIESFCKIIVRQREKAIELEESLKNEINANSYDSGIFSRNQTFGHSFMADPNLRRDNLPRCPEEKIEETELISEINAFLASLPKEKRKIFVARYWFFESAEEISKRTGKNKIYIRNTLNRTRTKLIKHLKERGFEL